MSSRPQPETSGRSRSEGARAREPRLGAIEGGGTKFLCAVGSSHERVVDHVRIDTTTPDETLEGVIAFLRSHSVERVGVATFGPLDLVEGRTLDTPKPGWDDVPVRAILADALGVPVAVDTDVNAAALAEQRWGAAKGSDPVVYVTVGTGVGGGACIGGRPLHGLLHPEMGHLRPLPVEGDDFEGACPFHGRCLEGLISGPALEQRLGTGPAGVPDDHPVWSLSARYLGRALAEVVLVLSPQRVVVGGGVAARLPLDVVRTELATSLAGYLARPELSAEHAKRFVVAPGLAAPGLVGAFALAATAGRVAPPDPL